jgi:hypothetical protein
MNNMREIKFRAWDTDLEEWVAKEEIKNLTLNSLKLSVRFKFMQFTALKDKNGVDIYEGDVVIEYESKNDVHGIKYEVAYESNGFWLKDRDNETGFGYTEDIEVIGNIYENPEIVEPVAEIPGFEGTLEALDNLKI